MVRVVELHVSRPAVEDEGAGAAVVAEAGHEGILTLGVHGQPLDDALLLKVPGGDDGQGCRGRMRERMNSVCGVRQSYWILNIFLQGRQIRAKSKQESRHL